MTKDLRRFMDVSWIMLLRTLHVAAAAVWFGAVIFGMFFLQPTLKAAGEGAKGFMGAVQKRGGFGRFMGPAAIVTLASGAFLYWATDVYLAPFGSIASSLLTIGAAIAILGWGFGMVVGTPIQKKLAALGAAIGPGGPTPEQATEMRTLQASMMRWGPVVGITVILAFFLMVGRFIVT